MAWLQTIPRTNDHVAHYTCLSTDTKETTGIYVGDVAYETDTGDKYEYRGSTAGWANVDSNGVSLTQPNWSGQLWAHNRYDDTAGSAGTNDNDVIYTSGALDNYNYHIIEATAGTVSIDVSIDGTNWIADVAVVDVTTTTPATRVVTLASGSMGILEGKFKNIRVLQSGATASNARIAHGWV